MSDATRPSYPPEMLAVLTSKPLPYDDPEFETILRLVAVTTEWMADDEAKMRNAAAWYLRLLITQASAAGFTGADSIQRWTDALSVEGQTFVNVVYTAMELMAFPDARAAFLGAVLDEAPNREEYVRLGREARLLHPSGLPDPDAASPTFGFERYTTGLVSPN